jgi:hypothetical protein
MRAGVQIHVDCTVVQSVATYGPDGNPVLDSSQRTTLTTMLNGPANETTIELISIPTSVTQ